MKTTLDSMCGGRVHVWQPERGYRFNTDSVFLAVFAYQTSTSDSIRALDLGTGCGIVAQLLHSFAPQWTIESLEIQPFFAQLARRSSAANAHGPHRPVVVKEGDWTTQQTHSHYDLIVCNPPYYAVNHGPLSEDPVKAGARQEVYGSVESALKYAKKALRPKGRVCFVYPVNQLNRLLSQCYSLQLTPVRMRFVHPFAHASAHTVLIECMPHAKRPLELLSPIVLYSAIGVYTEAVDQIFKHGIIQKIE